MNTGDLPDLDRMAPEDFIDNLVGMAGFAFCCNVTKDVRECIVIIIP